MKKHIFHKLRLPLVVLLAFVSLTACEKVVDIDDAIAEALVANGLPSVDSTLFVNVTYTRFFLDNTQFATPADAQVTVDVNGSPLPSDSRVGANFFFPYLVRGGDTLTLHVQLPGHEELIGGTRIPHMPAMDNFRAETDTTQPFTMGDILFTLNDEPGVHNYYYLYVIERDSGMRYDTKLEQWDTIDTVFHTWFSCLDEAFTSPAVTASEGLMGYYNSLLFSDSLFDGTQHEAKVSVFLYQDDSDSLIARSFEFVFQSLSQETFRYRQSVAQAQGMASYFAEQAQIYSNLHGGYGIFGGIATRRFKLQFEEYPEE